MIKQFQHARAVAFARDTIRRQNNTINEQMELLHVHQSYLRVLNRLTAPSHGLVGEGEDRLEKDLTELEGTLRIEGCKIADEMAKENANGKTPEPECNDSAATPRDLSMGTNGDMLI